jgi:hypothetical protein
LTEPAVPLNSDHSRWSAVSDEQHKLRSLVIRKLDLFSSSGVRMKNQLTTLLRPIESSGLNHWSPLHMRTGTYQFLKRCVSFWIPHDGHSPEIEYK